MGKVFHFGRSSWYETAVVRGSPQAGRRAAHLRNSLIFCGAKPAHSKVTDKISKRHTDEITAWLEVCYLTLKLGTPRSGLLQHAAKLADIGNFFES
jgi:hypothetical protein